MMCVFALLFIIVIVIRWTLHIFCCTCIGHVCLCRYLPQEVEAKCNLHRSGPQAVKINCKVHEPLSVGRNQRDDFSQSALLPSYTADPQTLQVQTQETLATRYQQNNDLGHETFLTTIHIWKLLWVSLRVRDRNRPQLTKSPIPKLKV